MSSSKLTENQEEDTMYKLAIGEILDANSDPTAKKEIATYDSSAKYNTNLKKINSFTIPDLEKALNLNTCDSDNCNKRSLH